MRIFTESIFTQHIKFKQTTMFLKLFSFLALLLTINADANHYRFRRQTSTGNTCPLPTGGISRRFQLVEFVFFFHALATPCDFGSCQNGADCESDFNDPDCVKCNCAVGFTGKFCQSEIINTGQCYTEKARAL